MRDKLWIISLDNLAGDDLPRMMELPNFRRFLEKAAYCRHVYSIYPSVTYPAHATIVTGKYPVHHGITNNTLFQPQRLAQEDWNWFSRKIRGKTLFDVAYEKDLSIASYLWPVRGGDKKITYNMPEIFPNRAWDHQVFTSLRHGSKAFQLEAFLKHGKELQGISQPALDDFLHHVVMDTVESRDPDVQFIHYVDMDATRHLYGHSSEEADQAIVRHDRRLGEILDRIEAEGREENTHIALLGDHSSLDEHAAVYLNVLFREKGWIRLKADGRVKSWKVISHTCDGCAYIHVKDPSLKEEAAALLKTFSEEHDQCIEKIYTRRQAKAFGAGGDGEFLVEARRGYYFLDEADGYETVHEIRPGDETAIPHITLSTHGYSPYKKNYQTFFSLWGPKIRPGEVEGPMRLIDAGPTIAYLMGGSLPEADGKPQMQFFL